MRSLRLVRTRLSGLIARGVSRRYLVRGGAFHQANPTINKAIVLRWLRRLGLGGAHGLSTCMGALGTSARARCEGADVTISETDPWVFADLEVNAASYRGRGVVHAARCRRQALSAAAADSVCGRRRL